MKLIDGYILKKLVVSFLFLLLIMTVITCVIDYSEKADAFAKHHVSWLEILTYFRNFLPWIISFLYPLFIFLSTIFFTSKMAYKSEVIAILASGTSFIRFLRPYIIGGVSISILFWYINHYILPVANKDRLAFVDKYINGIPTMSDRNVHLRISPQQYVYMESYDYTTNIGYKFSLETIDGILLKERIMADRASYDSTKKLWTLYNVITRTNDSLNEELKFDDVITRPISMLTPKDLLDDNSNNSTLTTPQLNKFIQLEKMRGRESLNFLYIEKYQRTAQPFAGIFMVIMAACLASNKIRGGSGFHLAIGVAISALYMMLLQFSNTFSTKGGLNPLIATWIPNILFFAVTLLLLRRRIK